MRWYAAEARYWDALSGSFDLVSDSGRVRRSLSELAIATIENGTDVYGQRMYRPEWAPGVVAMFDEEVERGKIITSFSLAEEGEENPRRFYLTHEAPALERDSVPASLEVVSYTGQPSSEDGMNMLVASLDGNVPQVGLKRRIAKLAKQYFELTIGNQY